MPLYMASVLSSAKMPAALWILSPTWRGLRRRGKGDSRLSQAPTDKSWIASLVLRSTPFGTEADRPASRSIQW